MANVTEDTTVHKYTVNVLYMLEGALMVAGNSLVIVAMLSHRNLRRKETLLLVGLAAADTISGIGFLSGGYKRLSLVMAGEDTRLVSGWDCMKYFQSVFFIVGAECQGLMQFLISFDRMLAIAFYQRYKRLTRTYTKMLLGAVATHACFSALICFLTSFLTLQNNKVGAICIGTWAVPEWKATYYTSVSAFGGMLSVVLYGVVCLVMMVRRQKFAATTSSQTAKLQRKFTITIGIVTIFTLCFHSIPYCVLIFLKNYIPADFYSLVSPYLWTTVNINSLVNIFVYVGRMTEVRNAVKTILSCNFSVNVQVAHQSTMGPADTSHNRNTLNVPNVKTPQRRASIQEAQNHK